MTDQNLRIGVIGIPGSWSSEHLADCVQERTGFRAVVDMNHVVCDLESGKVMAGDLELTGLDGLLIKKIGVEYSPEMLDRLEVLRYVASRGVAVMSSPESIIRILNRLTCTVTMAANQVPMPPTVITEDPEAAVETIETYGEAVLKPLFSTKARGMRLVVASETDVAREVREFQAEGNRSMYIQKKLDVPGRDLGLVFVGGKHVGTYARVRATGAWDTTTRSGGKYEAHEASPEIIEVARKAQQPFDMDLTSVDVVETDDGPLVFEVSAFGGFRGLKEGAGIDGGAAFVEHAIGKIRG